jgi:hypothetical protein
MRQGAVREQHLPQLGEWPQEACLIGLTGQRPALPYFGSLQVDSFRFEHSVRRFEACREPDNNMHGMCHEDDERWILMKISVEQIGLHCSCQLDDGLRGPKQMVALEAVSAPQLKRCLRPSLSSILKVKMFCRAGPPGPGYRSWPTTSLLWMLHTPPTTAP